MPSGLHLPAAGVIMKKPSKYTKTVKQFHRKNDTMNALLKANQAFRRGKPGEIPAQETFAVFGDNKSRRHWNILGRRF